MKPQRFKPLLLAERKMHSSKAHFLQFYTFFMSYMCYKELNLDQNPKECNDIRGSWFWVRIRPAVCLLSMGTVGLLLRGGGLRMIILLLLFVFYKCKLLYHPSRCSRNRNSSLIYWRKTTLLMYFCEILPSCGGLMELLCSSVRSYFTFGWMIDLELSSQGPPGRDGIDGLEVSLCLFLIL